MERLLNEGRIYNCGILKSRNSDQSKTTLLGFLSENKNFKEEAWKRRIIRGQISVNRSYVCDPNHTLIQDDTVCYHRVPWLEPVLNVEKITNDASNSGIYNNPDANGDDPHVLKIIYKDEHVMAIHKPSGVPTMPSQTFYEYSVLNALRRNTESSSIPPQPVHRLGVGTSGVLLIATSIEARKKLTETFRDKKVNKTYRALVQGANVPDTMKIDCPIGPVPFPIGNGTIYAACPKYSNTIQSQNNEQTKAKESLSLLRTIRRNFEEDTAVVEIEIPTGRPHQIRIHMAYAGHPLVGDMIYLKGGVPCCEKKLFPKPMREEEDIESEEEDGKTANTVNSVMRVPLPSDCGYILHAYQIIVPHPIRKDEILTITAKPPSCLL